MKCYINVYLHNVANDNQHDTADMHLLPVLTAVRVEPLIITVASDLDSILPIIGSTCGIRATPKHKAIAVLMVAMRISAACLPWGRVHTTHIHCPLLTEI